MTDPLENIYFISIPRDWSRKFPQLPLSEKTLLPVEIRGGIESWDASTLSWEMILSALLKVIAHHRSHKDIKEYRDLVLFIKPEIEDELSSLGILKTDQKEYQLAEELFLALEGLYPQKEMHHLNLALLYENMALHYKNLGQNHLSLEYLEKARVRYDNLTGKEIPESAYHSGLFYLKQGDISKGLEHLGSYIKTGEDKDKLEKARNLLAERASEKDDRYQKAYQLMIKENPQEAIETLTPFLQEHPTSWKGLFLMGWALRRSGRLKEAQVVFLKALKIRPASDLYNELAICELEQDHLAKAGEYLEKGLELAPQDIKILSNMAIYQLKKGDLDQGTRYFHRILEIDPQDPMALQYLKQLD